MKVLIPIQACKFSMRKTQVTVRQVIVRPPLTPRYVHTGSDQRQRRHVKDRPRGAPPTSNMNSDQMDVIWEGEL